MFSGDANASRFPSPTIKYSELDSSVDWEELRTELQGFAQKGLPEGLWACFAYEGLSLKLLISVTEKSSTSTYILNY